MQIRRSSLVIGLLVLFAVVRTPAQDKSSSGCWTWPDSLDAVAADPQNHTVLYEDAKIRVLDVHTPPHTTNSKHDHQWLSIFLQDEAQPRGRDHGTDGTTTQPGGEVSDDAPFPSLSVAGTQAPHAFENLDTFTKHFYRVEFQKIPFECPGKNGAMIFRKEAKRHGATPWRSTWEAIECSGFPSLESRHPSFRTRAFNGTLQALANGVAQVAHLRWSSKDVSGCSTASYEFFHRVRNEGPEVRNPLSSAIFSIT
jgi:hypothetical protein